MDQISSLSQLCKNLIDESSKYFDEPSSHSAYIQIVDRLLTITNNDQYVINELSLIKQKFTVYLENKSN